MHFTIDPKCPEICIYNYWKGKFSCKSSGGTTHLNRHINDGICPVFKRQLRNDEEKGQTLLNFTKDKLISESDQNSSCVEIWSRTY